MKKTSPVIILGAARSGTRLLRSLVASGEQHAEVPYDVNYIWRFGNESCPDDCLAASTVNDQLRAFVHRRLAKCAHAKPDQPIVEKTVSNVLRIPFVQSIYPEAKYVFLMRNGRDVIESAYRCWQQQGWLDRQLWSIPCSRPG